MGLLRKLRRSDAYPVGECYETGGEGRNAVEQRNCRVAGESASFSDAVERTNGYWMVGLRGWESNLRGGRDHVDQHESEDVDRRTQSCRPRVGYVGELRRSHHRCND